MSDEADDEELVDGTFEVAMPASRSEYVEYSGGPNGAGGTIIAPGGWEEFAANADALLVRVSDRTGDVEVITEVGKPWRAVDKGDRAGSLKSIKPHD